MSNSADAPAGAVPELSVVIPTYNRSAILRRTLEALDAQALPPERLEIVVVDDGSDDGTGAMLAELAPAMRAALRVVCQDHALGGSARNRGIDEARAPLVLLMDSDMTVQPGLLDAHLDAHRAHPERNAVFVGKVVTGPERIDLLDPDPAPGADRAAGPVPAEALTTQNVSLKRAFLIEAGSFRPGLPCLQDTELAFRLKRAGMRLFYLPGAAALHTQPLDTIEKVIHSGRKYGRTLAEWIDRVPEFREEMTAFGARFDGGWRYACAAPWVYLKDAARRLLINRLTAPLLERMVRRLPVGNPPSALLARCCRELWAYIYRDTYRRTRHRMRTFNGVLPKQEERLRRDASARSA
jgi:glycosyltransferase involved in cell wall biosynthesis